MIHLTERQLKKYLTEAANLAAERALQLMGDQNKSKWLHLGEALSLMGCSRSYLDSLVIRGVIRKNDYSKSTRRKYYNRFDVERYMELGPVPLPDKLIKEAITKSSHADY